MISIVPLTAIALATALAGPAMAAPLTLSDDDQSMVAGLCVISIKSPNVNDQNTLGIASWCINWQNRMKAAQAKPADPPPKADEPAKSTEEK